MNIWTHPQEATIVKQAPGPAGAAAVRPQVIPTTLGPCLVRIQPGAGIGRSGCGTADVFLHGAAGTWSTFLPLLSAAPARDRVLIDLPGWGGSTRGARLERLSLATMAEAVTGILDTLGYRRWNLIGHSMGGFVALHIAAAWPEHAASVATISATTFAVSEAVRAPARNLSGFPAFVGMLVLMRSLAALGPAGSALLRAVGATPAMGPLMSPFFANPAAVSAGVIRGLGNDARPAAFAAAARAAACYDFSQWRGIRCPALAIRGDCDVLTPPSDHARLAGMVPQLATVTIPRSGHFAHVEQPEQVLRLLDELHRTGASSGSAVAATRRAAAASGGGPWPDTQRLGPDAGV